MRTLVILLIFLAGGLSLSAQTVSFKLHNSTTKKIPLEIPGVMNPILSPMSWSGVNLEVGQKIYFTQNGKRTLLLEVDKSYEGKKVNVRKLIRQRKKESKT